MIAKIPPRSKAVKAATTRRSTFALLAYLLGRGDKDKAELYDSRALEGGHSTGGTPEPPGSGNHHEQPRVVCGGGDAVVAHGAVTLTNGIDWASGDDGGCWREEARIASQLAASMVECVPGPERGGNATWHAILALHPADGTLTEAQWQQLLAERGTSGVRWPQQPLQGGLSDEQWATIARRAMKETGYDTGDGNGVQWVAVRHGRNDAGADHVHIAAVMIRPDGSRPARHNDAAKLHRVAAWAEQKFGLIPQARGKAARSRQRLDRDAPRGELEAVTKMPDGGAPYQRPPGLHDEEWQRIRQRLQPSAWTRLGRTRADVLSAAARAVSRDHLEALLADQGYRITWRYSTKNPVEVTGWSITAPHYSDPRDGRHYRAKSYRGGALGKDCTWPAVHSRLQHRNVSLGLGTLVGTEEDEAMLSKKQMLAAGWGEPFIAEVVAKDLQLARRQGDEVELTGLAYWLRDAFWQAAWRLEGQHGQHGPWTDAAYLYSAMAVDGPPPPPPQELLDIVAEQDARIERARANKRPVAARIDERDRIEQAWLDWSEGWHRAVAWARRDEPVPVPVPSNSPAAASLRGAATMRLADYTVRQWEAADALRQASAAHRQATAVIRQLHQAEKMDGVWLDQQNAIIIDAKTKRARALQQLDRYRQAEQAWRDRMGRLLVDARVNGEAGSAPGPVVDATDRLHEHQRAHEAAPARG